MRACPWSHGARTGRAGRVILGGSQDVFSKQRIHPPGAHLIICSAGHAFGDLIGVLDDRIGAYADVLARGRSRWCPRTPLGWHRRRLRHTGNTLASTAGAGTRELMTRMGHSSSRAALIYQHMTSDRDRAVADRLGRHDPWWWRSGLGRLCGVTHSPVGARLWHDPWNTKGQPRRESLLSRPFFLCPRQDSNLRHPL
ncbi:L-tyrosine/L-tryptophan isonitrile synthase family protein [Streptomyces misionensis]|uniref:L-tyrosine/L-tryptophan isonitrile synthase family protein n=1 Tax=Streptomyces misionensis TaxID=67331 RepID=UPI003BB0C296